MILPSIVIRELEKRSGVNLASPSDHDLTKLSQDILEVTKGRLSINTLKRLLGRFADDSYQPRVSTLNFIANYLGKPNWPMFLVELSNGSSSFAPIDGELLADMVQPGQMVQVRYLPDRMIRFLCLGGGRFEVAESENSKLQVGDIGQIVAFIPRFPLLVRNIERDGVLFGTSYTAGRVSGLTEVAVLEQV